jgi:hypothetical protein
VTYELPNKGYVCSNIVLLCHCAENCRRWPHALKIRHAVTWTCMHLAGRSMAQLCVLGGFGCALWGVTDAYSRRGNKLPISPDRRKGLDVKRRWKTLSGATFLFSQLHGAGGGQQATPPGHVWYLDRWKRDQQDQPMVFLGSVYLLNPVVNFAGTAATSNSLCVSAVWSLRAISRSTC